MTVRNRIVAVLCGAVLWAAAADAQPTPSPVISGAATVDAAAPQGAGPVELNGDSVEYIAGAGKAVATGNVILRQGPTTLRCDRLEYYRDRRQANAAGHVVLVSPQGTVWADKAFYDFNRHKGEFTEARIMAYPMFAQAHTISRINENYFVMSDGDLSTSDYDNPEWRVHSRLTELYPGVRAIAHDSTMFFGDVPVMFFPRYTQDLRENRPHFSVTPGYSKSWGAYALTTYRVSPVVGLDTIYHVDYRELRDLAWGVDLKWSPERYGRSLLRTYYMNERSVGASHLWENRTRPTTERERYRLEWRHQWQVSPATSLIAQAARASDPDVIKEYSELEYRADKTPDTFALLTHNTSSTTTTLRVDKRINSFETKVERLPELTWAWNSQPVGDTGFYFRSDNRLSELVSKNAAPSDVSHETTRMVTDNQVSRPLRMAFLEVTPYAGHEETWWSKALEARDDNSLRGVFRTGVDVSTKFYRVYDTSFRALGVEVNRLRHVVSPTVSYLYRHDPTMPDGKVYVFDDVDSRTGTNQFSLGLENKLQTKRQKQVVDLVRSLLSTTYTMRDNGVASRFGDVTLTDEINPNAYVSLRHDHTYDSAGAYLRTANYEAVVRDNRRWELGVSSRYTRDDDDILTAQLSWIINPKWRTVIYDRWNADRGVVQEQQYALTRDLHSWEVEFSFRDKNQSADAGSEIWLVFRLKAFPSVNVNGGSGFNRAKAGSQSAL